MSHIHFLHLSNFIFCQFFIMITTGVLLLCFTSFLILFCSGLGWLFFFVWINHVFWRWLFWFFFIESKICTFLFMIWYVFVCLCICCFFVAFVVFCGWIIGFGRVENFLWLQLRWGSIGWYTWFLVAVRCGGCDGWRQWWRLFYCCCVTFLGRWFFSLRFPVVRRPLVIAVFGNWSVCVDTLWLDIFSPTATPVSSIFLCSYCSSSLKSVSLSSSTLHSFPYVLVGIDLCWHVDDVMVNVVSYNSY